MLAEGLEVALVEVDWKRGDGRGTRYWQKRHVVRSRNGMERAVAPSDCVGRAIILESCVVDVKVQMGCQWHGFARVSSLTIGSCRLP